MIFKLAISSIFLSRAVLSFDGNCSDFVDFDGKYLDEVPKFAWDHCVERLDLSLSNITNISNINEAAFKNLRLLEELNLKARLNSSKNVFLFNNLSKLRYLDLGIQDPEPEPRVSTISINASYPNLKRLNLTGLGTSKLLVQNWTKLMPKLEQLSLSRNRLKLTDLVKDLPVNLKLLWVEYNDNDNHYLKMDGFQDLWTLDVSGHKFENLYITDNVATCQSDHQLCIGYLKTLDLIWINSCDIHVFNIQYFSFDPLPSLKTLSLFDNKLKTLGNFGTMSLIPTLLSLETLNLGQNRLRSIENLCSLRNLTILYLNYNDEHPVSLDLSSDIESCLPNLRDFEFCCNNLTDVSKPFFKKLLNLESINLYENQLRKFSLASKTLKHLYIVYNEIERLEDLKLDELPALEEVQITFNSSDHVNVNYLNELRGRMNFSIYYQNLTNMFETEDN